MYNNLHIPAVKQTAISRYKNFQKNYTLIQTHP